MARLRENRWMSAWADARLRPKLLLATQTRVLEVAVDERGAWLPVTPLISIVPRTNQDLWLLGAALSSPVLAAVGARLSAGTALARNAIKLSATQVRGLPLPARGKEWAKAGSLFKQATRAGQEGRYRLLIECSEAMCRAYGHSAGNAKKLMNWWKPRLGSTS
jgi:hypothetical protein